MGKANEQTGIWMYCTGSAIRRASRQLGQLYDDALAPSGLRNTQYALLSQISLSGEPALRVLAEALVMDLSALGRTLKPLERDGLLELVPDEHDRRVKRARLTPLGKHKQQEASALWEAAQARFDEIIGAGDSAAMRDAMGVIASPAFAQAFAAKRTG